MKPSNVRQIVAQDFKPEDQDMAARLGGVLNYFMRQMVEILNENVDFDNLAWEVITVDVQVDANGIPVQTTRFTSDVEYNKFSYLSNNCPFHIIYPSRQWCCKDRPCYRITSR
jgi:hypothetical protein